MAGVKNILIISPDNPDDDSVSSNIALAETFTRLGKKVVLLSHEPLPDSLEWMATDHKFLTKQEFVKQNLKPDLSVITDAGGLSQMENALAGHQYLVEETKTLIIDHHATRDDFVPSLGIIDPNSAATGELLYYLYQKMGWEITPRLAELMLIGILSDTGNFQNLNTDAKVLEVAARLIELGADIYETNQKMLYARAFTPDKFKVLAELAANTKFKLPIVYGLIPYSEVSKFGANSGITHAFGQLIRYLKGVRVSFILSEKEDGTLRLSLRAQPEYDVSKVAKHFGGGGHKVAAGASIAGKTLDEAAKEVLKLLENSN